MTDNERQKVEKKIEALRETVAARNADLRDKQSLHAAAWEEYGSELCAGGMQREEREIRQDIDAISADINLLLAHLRGEVPSEVDAETVGAHDEAIAEAIKTLEEKRKPIQERLGKINRIRELLG